MLVWRQRCEAILTTVVRLVYVLAIFEMLAAVYWYGLKGVVQQILNIGCFHRMFFLCVKGNWNTRLHKKNTFLSPGATQPIVGAYFTALYRSLASSRTWLLDHTQRRATVGRTPLNEWSVCRRDLYLTTHNTHNRQTSMPRLGFEPTIAAGERP